MSLPEAGNSMYLDSPVGGLTGSLMDSSGRIDTGSSGDDRRRGYNRPETPAPLGSDLSDSDLGPQEAAAQRRQTQAMMQLQGQVISQEAELRERVQELEALKAQVRCRTVHRAAKLCG